MDLFLKIRAVEVLAVDLLHCAGGVAIRQIAHLRALLLVNDAGRSQDMQRQQRLRIERPTGVHALERYRLALHQANSIPHGAGSVDARAERIAVAASVARECQAVKGPLLAR